jgi:hypothetical protein
MLKRVFLLSFFLLLINTGCKKAGGSTNGVPVVNVNLTIDINNTGYTSLKTANGWVYVSGGYDGILVYCETPGTFAAYDRGCPYDCQTNTAAIITVQSGNTTAKCPVCGTTYSLLTSDVISGPGTVALSPYVANFVTPNITIGN